MKTNYTIEINSKVSKAFTFKQFQNKQQADNFAAKINNGNNTLTAIKQY